MPDEAPPPSAESATSTLGVAVLLASVFAASGCAIIYELLIGTISSYFLGDSVEQFSLTIGFFLAAMGAGSWASRLCERDLLAKFISIELCLGLAGGCSVPALYAVYSYSGQYRYWMILFILAIGGMVGLELPLLARILRQYGTLRQVLADLLSLDYLGSLIAALLFPYLLLPLLGTFDTALVTGGINVGIGVALLVAFRGALNGRRKRLLALQSVLFAAVLGGLLLRAEALRERWESNLYSDRIVYSVQSPYQRVVLTEWKEEISLFLDGHLQFSSTDEYRYHEALVHPAMSLASSRERVLIVGGGDGLSAREVLKYPDVAEVDLVDIDQAVTNLARRDVRMTNLNRNALNRSQVRILNEDAFLFIQQEQIPYGVIIVDLPDPRFDSLSKLYSVEGYRLLKRHLARGGMLVTQATSPYFTRKTFWSIGKTLAESGLRAVPYHVPVPSLGEWGFFLAADAALPPLTEAPLVVPTSYLRPEMLRPMTVFPPDMRPVEVEANHLDRPLLAQYYREDWGHW